MRKLIFTVTVILFCAGCTSVDSNNEKLVSNLENQLDSLSTIIKSNLSKDKPDYATYHSANNLQLELADSLYKLDPNNSTALHLKALDAFNARYLDESKLYFLRIHEQAQLNGLGNLVLGLCFELQERKDSAYYFYEIALEKSDSSYNHLISKSQLLTVLKGKEEGLKELELTKPNLDELLYLQISNDIRLYQNEGLTSMFPIFIQESLEHGYEIIVPKKQKEQGKFSTEYDFKLFLAELGINVYCTKSNTGFTVYTTNRYTQQLEQMETIEIKKL